MWYFGTSKIRKGTKKERKRNARSFWQKGTEQELVPQIPQRNEEGTRSSKIRKFQCMHVYLIAKSTWNKTRAFESVKRTKNKYRKLSNLGRSLIQADL